MLSGNAYPKNTKYGGGDLKSIKEIQEENGIRECPICQKHAGWNPWKICVTNGTIIRYVHQECLESLIDGVVK